MTRSTTTSMTSSMTRLAGMTALAAALALPAFAQSTTPGAAGKSTDTGAAPGMTSPVPAAPGHATPGTTPGTPLPGKVAPGATTGAMGTTSHDTMGVKSLAATGGDRASKIIGASVTNEAKETVGTVDDLIVTPDDQVPVAVLSVGGFLGMGTKYVAVPFKDLKVTDKGVMMPGATKKSLKDLPSFKYQG